jgi:hypothetical protein
LPELSITSDGTPVDLTAYTVEWALKGVGAGYPAEGIPVTGTGSDGKVSATILPELTALIPPGRYRESFRVTFETTVRTFSRNVQVARGIF